MQTPFENENESFLIRWRGKQEGPYTAAVIETKLAANQIGLLHEIAHNGQWVTLRDYFAAREVTLCAERQAREEQQRQAHEEADRQAKEREEQRRVDLVVEERRRAAQAEVDSSRNQQPGAYPHTPAQPPGGSSSLRTFGILLLLAGIAVTGYFFLAFDSSVESGMGRVSNLGLMADRQNGIIVGIGLGVVGTIVLVIRARDKN